MKTALIIGATGLVGAECINYLLASGNYTEVIALVRKQPTIQHPKLRIVIVDFDNLQKYAQQITADDVYCSIGTTIAKAGSQEAFRKTDYDIPFKVAELAKANGAKKFILVSAIGASSSSAIFYSRVKGELEDALKKLDYSSLVIFRPSLLLGNRQEKRTGEDIGQWVAKYMPFVFFGPLKKYRGVEVGRLGKAMVVMGEKDNKGVRIIENDEIFALAEV